MKNDLTTGSVARTLIKFTIPLIIANLLQALYGIADMVIVGLFSGPHSLSAVSTSGQFTTVIIMLISGLTIGATVMIAQYQGAKEYEEQRKTIGSLIALCIVIAVAITAITLMTGKLILNALNTPPEAYSEAYKYYMICMCGTIFITGYNAISSIMRGRGDSKTPLTMVAIAASTNVVLDLILVGVFKMGAAGAAYATVSAQALSMFLSIFMIKSSFSDIKLSDIRFHKGKVSKLLSIGVPSSIQQTMVSFSFLFLISLINSFGVNASAAAGIAAKVNGFAILPGVAMMVAISAMSAQNIGAKQLDRAKLTMITGLKIIIPFMLVMFTIIMLFSGAIIRMFTNEAEVIELGIKYLRISSGEYLFVSVVFCLNGLIMGAGHTKFTLLNSFVSAILVRIPLAMILSRLYGFYGIAIATSFAPISSLILGVVYIQFGFWKKQVIPLAPEDF